MADAATVVATSGARSAATPSAMASTVPGMRLPSPAGGGSLEQLGAVLRRITTVLAEPSYGQWDIRMPEMRRIARVELSAEWLRMSLPLRALTRSPDAELIGGMLDRNARIFSSPRIIGPGLQRQRQIVIDVAIDLFPWDSEAALETFTAGVIESIGAAVDAISRPSATPPPAELPREELVRAFDEAGWPVQSSKAERLEVPLEVPDTYLAARISHDSRSTRLTVPMLVDELAAAPRECRYAVIVLLWLMVSRVRMVKATRSRRALALEVSLLPGHTGAAALAHGCAALSATLQQLSTEAKLLAADDRLAQIYLANLGLNTAA